MCASSTVVTTGLKHGLMRGRNINDTCIVFLVLVLIPCDGGRL